MPRFEDICQRIFTDSDVWRKLLIGGLIGLVPILQICSLGYCLSYARQISTVGSLSLPDWSTAFKRIDRLFLDGLLVFFFLILFSLVFWVLGIGVTKGFFLLNPLNWWSFFSFEPGYHRYMPIACAMLFAPPLTAAALFLYLSRGRFQDVLRIDSLARLLAGGWRAMVIPQLAFTCLILLAWPLFGFAFFLGFVVILAYYTVVFVALRKTGAVDLQAE